jgi:lipooligosaccharide transport system permease protein
MTAGAIPAGARYLIERNLRVHRRTWMVIFSGFFEPLFFLFSMGFGLGHYIGRVGGVEYAAFIAPALLAAAAMNGAVLDASNVFWKMKYSRLYDAVLSTPVSPVDVAVGEAAWALFRGLLYAVGFLVVIASLGLVGSWWALLALPAATLIGFAFAGLGVAAATSMRTWQDYELITLVQLPMFLFSTTFYPLSVYPDAIRWVVRCLPLYHAIELLRALCSGAVGPLQLGNAAYLVVLGVLGITLATRRIDRLLLS